MLRIFYNSQRVANGKLPIEQQEIIHSADAFDEAGNSHWFTSDGKTLTWNQSEMGFAEKRLYSSKYGVPITDDPCIIRWRPELQIEPKIQEADLATIREAIQTVTAIEPKFPKLANDKVFAQTEKNGC